MRPRLNARLARKPLSWRWVNSDRCVSLCGRYAVCKVRSYWQRAELWRLGPTAVHVGTSATAPDAMRLAQKRLTA